MRYRALQVQESIRSLLEECAAHLRKRPEQCMATASVNYGDAMNVKRYRSRMKVVFEVRARLNRISHKILAISSLCRPSDSRTKSNIPICSSGQLIAIDPLTDRKHSACT